MRGRAATANFRKILSQITSRARRHNSCGIRGRNVCRPHVSLVGSGREKEGDKQMFNRHFVLPAFAALVLAVFFSPSTAKAQTVWDRIRDRAEQERDRAYGRNGRRDDGTYGRRGGRISDYDRRQLRDLSRRISDRSHDLQRDIDRALDSSRINGSRREDNINQEARDLRNAADRFRNVAGDSNDLYRSSDEARQLLDQGSR